MSEPHRVRQWAEALISSHLDSSWTFGFDNAKRRAGQCDYTRRRITVSRYLSARYDDDTNHQTLLHEVAHALAGATASATSAARPIAARPPSNSPPGSGCVRPGMWPTVIVGHRVRPHAHDARRGSTSGTC